MRLKIASRKSDLARIQAYQVGEELKKAHPHLEIEYFFRESLGDQNLQDPLWKMPERGVFTEDFVQGLVNSEFDLVVHSWKDLPTAHRAETEIVATLPRADARDLILFKKKAIESLRRDGGILQLFSSSPRREHNLKPFLKEFLPFAISEVQFSPVRGNVQTRIQKMLDAPAIHGLVVAKAALDRLLSASREEFLPTAERVREMLSFCNFMIAPLSQCPSAAAQGALAIEIKRSRSDLKGLVKTINCATTFMSADLERRWLARFGGGCHLKIGVSAKAEAYGDILFLRGLAPDGKKWTVATIERQDPPLKVEPEKMWPGPRDEESFFDRKDTETHELKQRISEAQALFIARESALPNPVPISESAWLWTAGCETWKKLARRGIWVHGTSDGLGESRPELDALASERLEWLRLTHSGAVENKNDLGVYRLEPKPQGPSLEGKTHFYWKSGSQFERAVALNPWILKMHHGCGPGKTFTVVSQKVHDLSRVRVYLNWQHWWDSLKDISSERKD